VTLSIVAQRLTFRRHSDIGSDFITVISESANYGETGWSEEAILKHNVFKINSGPCPQSVLWGGVVTVNILWVFISLVPFSVQARTEPRLCRVRKSWVSARDMDPRLLICGTVQLATPQRGDGAELEGYWNNLSKMRADKDGDWHKEIYIITSCEQNCGWGYHLKGLKNTPEVHCIYSEIEKSP
jgi:hypothetical protein